MNLNMDFGEKSKVVEVLSRAYSGSVVDKHVAAAAIREFEGILDDLRNQPPKWEYVTMKRSDVSSMREIIKFQDQKIQEMTQRMNLMSRSGHSSPARPLSTSDNRRRLDIADRFNAVYDTEWRSAFRELTDTMRWRDLECVYSLMRVIRNACDLCINLAEDQMDKLLICMEDNMIDPLNGTGGRFKQVLNGGVNVYSDGMKVAEKYAIDYRAERAESSVPAVIQLFMDTKLRAIIDTAYLKKDFKRYVERVVELIWLMTTLEPPVRLFWQQQTERINTDFFYFYDRKGDFVNQTVWPAVFMHNTGQLLHKGHVLAM